MYSLPPPLSSISSSQVMIVHQQLAALAGNKSKKHLEGVAGEEGDPPFNPNHPNKKKKPKRVHKKEGGRSRKPATPTPTAPAPKKPPSKSVQCCASQQLAHGPTS